MNRAKAVYSMLCILFLAGLVLLFYAAFARSARNAKARLGLRSLRKKMNAAGLQSSTLADMLYLALGMKGENAVLSFLLLSAGLGLAAFVPLYAGFGPGLGLYGMIAAAAYPYIFVRTRLQNRQAQMSREGEQLLTELLNNYRIHRYVMREAIEATALTAEEAPLSRQRLLDLSRALNAAISSQQLREAIEKFRISLGTSWGDLLAANLEFAVIDGISVTESLRDLIAEVSDARRKAEQMKRENSDSGMVLKFLFPGMCLMIYFGSTLCFGMSTAEFLNNQFHTGAGLFWFICMAVSYVVSLLVLSAIERRKMDI